MVGWQVERRNQEPGGRRLEAEERDKTSPLFYRHRCPRMFKRQQFRLRVAKTALCCANVTGTLSIHAHTDNGVCRVTVCHRPGPPTSLCYVANGQKCPLEGHRQGEAVHA